MQAYEMEESVVRLNSTFQKVSKKFAIDFNELAGEVAHRQSAGEARERALIALLKNNLPSRVGVEQGGFVIDAHGNESAEMDVVIYDKSLGTVFNAVEGERYFPCETVIAVGEVKTNVDSNATLTDALEKLRSVKELDRLNKGKNRAFVGPGIAQAWIEFNPHTNYRDQIFGFVFTSSSMRRDTLVSSIQRFNASTPKQHWMNLFCAFNKLVISYQTPNGLSPNPMEATSLYCTKDTEIPDLLLLFYCILASFVDVAHVAKPNYFDYGSIPSSGATYHELAP
jgi:hypothetical protein